MVRCPGCGGPSIFAAQNPYRPFCSARCKHNDLGAGASEDYRGEARLERDDDHPEPPQNA